jgi:hypothetical protein
MSADTILSPGFVRGAAAYELKVRLPTDLVGDIEGWARRVLTPDPNGQDGQYRVASVYCDTTRFDVYRREPGYRRSKYRLRRYGDHPLIYLERKTRRGDRVWKRRDAIAAADLAYLAGVEPPADWVGSWFLQRVRRNDLRPTCQIVYLRSAFLGGSSDSPLRLTVDRDLIGWPIRDWEVDPGAEGKRLLSNSVILELKFRDHLPELFRELLATLPPDLGRVSKYRLCVRSWGLAGEEI